MITNLKQIDIKRIIKAPAFWIAVAVVIGIVVAIISATSNSAPATQLKFEGEKLIGIDVSSHNGNIDWGTLKDDIDFAFIRVGYRGYGTGSVNLDKNAKSNIKKATKNGIPVGVYFYSQATTDEEAVEEAEFVLDIIEGLDVALPVVIDFEYAYDENGDIAGRLYEANLTKAQNTSLINAFCQTIENAGYQSGIYASTNVYENKIDTNKLSENAIIWVAEYSDKLSYTGDYDIWQYSKTGTLDGIGSKYVDLNYWYVKNE